MTRALPRGLYAVTPQGLCDDARALNTAAEAALAGGAVMLQYRDKQGTPAQRRRNAEALAARCRAAGALFIVNDDVALAAACGADGVHLGQQDAALAEARAALGPDAVIGVSCGPVLARVQQAAAGGADYAAVGRMYPSATKPDAPGATLDDLRAARAATALPLCAIGGVLPGHVPALVAAGADLVAAVAGVFDAPDIEAAARAYATAFAGPSR